MVFLYQAASGRGIICRLFEGKTKNLQTVVSACR